MSISDFILRNSTNLSALSSHLVKITPPEIFLKNDDKPDPHIHNKYYETDNKPSLTENSEIKEKQSPLINEINRKIFHPHPEDPISYAEWYLRLSKCQRKIIQFLFDNFLRYGENSFPAIITLAKFANCSLRNVNKFLQKCKWFGQTHNFKMLKIIPRYKPWGAQTTNQYKISNYLKCALNWLKTYGYLNASFEKTETILSSMRKLGTNILKFTPPSPQSSPPYTDSSLKGSIRSDTSVNFILRGLPVKQDALFYCSQHFSDHVLLEARRSTEYAIGRGMIKKSPEAFLIGSCKKIQLKV